MGVQHQIVPTPTGLPVGTRVLIVEDQPLVALAVADMVGMLDGVVVDVAATVEEALVAVGRGGFDLALLDIDLDGRTSDPVAAALGAANTPFVITTGFQDRTIAGFEHMPVLLKPYLPHQLCAILQTLLEPQANAA